MGSKQKLELLCTFNLNLCKILFVTPRLFFFSNSVKSYQFRRGLLDIKFWHLFRQIGFILQFYQIALLDVSQSPHLLSFSAGSGLRELLSSVKRKTRKKSNSKKINEGSRKRKSRELYLKATGQFTS
jgi:hypothetical protein